MTNTPQEPLSPEFVKSYQRALRAVGRAFGGESKCPAFMLMVVRDMDDENSEYQIGGNVCVHGFKDMAMIAAKEMHEQIQKLDAEAAKLN